MVIIDENGNKVNIWTEIRIDTNTCEVVEEEHKRILSMACDWAHWRLRVMCDNSDFCDICQPTLFIYASDEILQSVEKLLESIAKHCNGDAKVGTDKLHIPLSQFIRVMVGSEPCSGTLLRKTMLPAGVLALLTDCDVASAKLLCDALFEIFPEIDYIEICD